MKNSPVLENIINTLTSERSNLFRFCLSDQVSQSLAGVVSDVTDPITYAARLTKRSAKAVLEKLPPPAKALSTKLRQAYVYDEVASAALMFRLTNLFPTDPGRIDRFFVLARLYLLNTDEPNSTVTIGGGLCNFGRIVPKVMQNSPTLFTSSSSIFLSKLLQHTGSIDTPQWFMWDKRWSALFTYPSRLRILRRFLHASFSSFVMDEEDVQEFHNLSKDDLLMYMSEFVELRASTRTTSADIARFIDRLRFHFDSDVQHPALSLLLEAPYYLNELFFTECQENLQLFQHRLHHHQIAIQTTAS